MANSEFYDAGPLKQIAINLFYGWGYNFYRIENQLRSDDLLIRGKADALLGSARESVSAAESAYRREFLPPPSRQKPFPEASAVSGAQAIERLAQAISALQGQITALPAPENDRMSQRYREEAATLAELLDCDERLIGQAETLRAMLDRKDGAWLIANTVVVNDGVHAITETLRQRQALLF